MKIISEHELLCKKKRQGEEWDSWIKDFNT